MTTVELVVRVVVVVVVVFFTLTDRASTIRAPMASKPSSFVFKIVSYVYYTKKLISDEAQSRYNQQQLFYNRYHLYSSIT